MILKPGDGISEVWRDDGAIGGRDDVMGSAGKESELAVGGMKSESMSCAIECVVRNSAQLAGNIRDVRGFEDFGVNGLSF